MMSVPRLPTYDLATLASSAASGTAAATARAAASVVAWQASSQVFMSAKRCLSAW